MGQLLFHIAVRLPCGAFSQSRNAVAASPNASFIVYHRCGRVGITHQSRFLVALVYHDILCAWKQTIGGMMKKGEKIMFIQWVLNNVIPLASVLFAGIALIITLYYNKKAFLATERQLKLTREEFDAKFTPAILVVKTLYPLDTHKNVNKDEPHVFITLHNAGPGVAFNIRGALFNPDITWVLGVAGNPREQRSSNGQVPHWVYWDGASLTTNESSVFDFAQYDVHIFKYAENFNGRSLFAPNDEKPSLSASGPTFSCKLTITYEDINHHTFTSVFSLRKDRGWSLCYIGKANQLLEDIVS